MEKEYNLFSYIKDKKPLRNMDRFTSYQAFQSGFEREVFLYNLKLYYSDTEKILDYCEDMFKRLSKIEDNSITSIIDIMRVEKELFILFRKPVGDTIPDMFKKGILLSSDDVWRIARSLAGGYSNLHKSGIYPKILREFHLFYENERCLRFHPDIFIEMLGALIDAAISQNKTEADNNPSDDMAAWGRYITCLLIGDQGFRLLYSLKEKTQYSDIQSINISERNSSVTRDQEELLKLAMLSITTNTPIFKDFDELIERLNKVVV